MAWTPRQRRGIGGAAIGWHDHEDGWIVPRLLARVYTLDDLDRLEANVNCLMMNFELLLIDGWVAQNCQGMPTIW